MSTTEEIPVAPPAHEEQQQQQQKKAKKPKVKHTWMLHCPVTMRALCKIQSADARYAALKCSSRLHKLPETTKGEEEGTVKIWLRRTNTKCIREYIGRVQEINPTQVVRSGRVITYTKRPVVKFSGKMWTWDGALEGKEEEEEDVPEMTR